MDVKKYFGSFPNVDVLHITSDNIVFTDDKKAKKHQSTLRKGSLETINRKPKTKKK